MILAVVQATGSLSHCFVHCGDKGHYHGCFPCCLSEPVAVKHLTLKIRPVLVVAAAVAMLAGRHVTVASRLDSNSLGVPLTNLPVIVTSFVADLLILAELVGARRAIVRWRHCGGRKVLSRGGCLVPCWTSKAALYSMLVRRYVPYPSRLSAAAAFATEPL